MSILIVVVVAVVAAVVVRSVVVAVVVRSVVVAVVVRSVVYLRLDNSPLPDDIVDALIQSRNANQGVFNLRQVGGISLLSFSA